MSSDGIPLLEQGVRDVDEECEERLFADWAFWLALFEERWGAIGVLEEAGIHMDYLNTFCNGRVSVAGRSAFR